MRDRMKILVTGGCGFIGAHAVHRWLARHEVLAVDSLARAGSRSNLTWLQGQGEFEFRQLDIRQSPSVTAVVRDFRPDVVLHAAAQVAVTTSVADPRTDFEINALGTLNLLEAVRHHAPEAIFLYASTNKVYGGMEGVRVELMDGRYAYADLPDGVPESQPLDFHSPYGCSKGAGDQYTLDYARIYGLRTVVFRQSCIYGTRQFGMEDQGWVAWFTIRSVQGRPVTVYGDGRQVRDVLWIDDLLDAYESAVRNISRASGQAYNIGGGPAFTLSLRELMAALEQHSRRPLEHGFADWRPGDQRVFVADPRKAARDLGWQPRTAPPEGIRRLHSWVDANRSLFDAEPVRAPRSDLLIDPIESVR